METFFSLHPITTHMLAVLLGGPLFGILVNHAIAMISKGASSPLRRAAATWLSTTPALAQAAFAAVAVPGLSEAEREKRLENLIDAGMTATKVAIDAAEAPKADGK